MFFLGSPVVIFLIGMGVDDRHPVHYMNVGKSYQHPKYDMKSNGSAILKYFLNPSIYREL